MIGDGPLGIVFVPGVAWHLEVLWEEASVARFFERLASFGRLLLFDKRGQGLSDRPGGPPTLEDTFGSFAKLLVADDYQEGLPEQAVDGLIQVMDEDCGGPVLVSSTVRDLVVGSGVEFGERGEHALKGVPGDWPLYAVERA